MRVIVVGIDDHLPQEEEGTPLSLSLSDRKIEKEWRVREATSEWFVAFRAVFTAITIIPSALFFKS